MKAFTGIVVIVNIILIVIQFFILKACKKREKESQELYERFQSIALNMSQDMNEFDTQMKETCDSLYEGVQAVAGKMSRELRDFEKQMKEKADRLSRKKGVG
ncbi:MAG: hypothetical protein RR733_04835 [Victivallaceae bacterium]